MSPNRPYRRFAVLSFCALAVLGGCASFRGNELEVLDRNVVLAGERLPPVTSEFFVGLVHAGASGWPKSTIHNLFRDAFESVQYPPPPGGDEAHPTAARSADKAHIEVFVESRARHGTFGKGLRLLTILSLGIIPSCVRYELVLSAKVFHGEEVAWRRDYRDHVTEWAHLFMMPWAPSRHLKDVRDDVLVNMLLHLVRDLEQERSIVAPLDTTSSRPAQRAAG